MRLRIPRKSALLALAGLLALLGLGTTVAQGERALKGNVEVIFNGGISPRQLPRHGMGPVNVITTGKVKSTVEGVQPPKLQRIILEINSHGQLQNKGLPTCSLGKLNSISSKGAEKACGKALVGHGNVTSRLKLPDQPVFASNGPLLAFNARYHGHPAIFAQVSTTAPLPLTYVIIFEIKKEHGTFGTSLVGTLPPIASEYGYISAFNLSLKRTYTYKGQKLSYASAGCPAPKGTTVAPFSFARASYEFEGGLKLSSTLQRECKARGK
jgi:hypothetical protein